MRDRQCKCEGLFISWSVMGVSDALSCARVTLVETGSAGEPGLLLEHFAMCAWERQRKGVLGSQPVGSECSAVHGSGTCKKRHSKELSIRKAITILGSTNQWQERQRGEKGGFLLDLCMHWHQVLLEPRHSFTSPESSTHREWQLPLNWSPSFWVEFQMLFWVRVLTEWGFQCPFAVAIAGQWKL